jgi:hypothetical protein
MGDQPDARLRPTQDNINTETGGHTPMRRVVFEPTIPVFERPKTVCALDRAAIGTVRNVTTFYSSSYLSRAAKLHFPNISQDRAFRYRTACLRVTSSLYSVIDCFHQQLLLKVTTVFVILSIVLFCYYHLN